MTGAWYETMRKWRQGGPQCAEVLGCGVGRYGRVVQGAVEDDVRCLLRRRRRLILRRPDDASRRWTWCGSSASIIDCWGREVARSMKLRLLSEWVGAGKKATCAAAFRFRVHADGGTRKALTHDESIVKYGHPGATQPAVDAGAFVGVICGVHCSRIRIFRLRGIRENPEDRVMPSSTSCRRESGLRCWSRRKRTTALGHNATTWQRLRTR